MHRNKLDKACPPTKLLLLLLSISQLANQIIHNEWSSKSVMVDAFVLPGQSAIYRTTTIIEQPELTLKNRHEKKRQISRVLGMDNDRSKEKHSKTAVFGNAGWTDPSKDPSGADEFSSFYEDTVYPLLQKLDEALNGSGDQSSSTSSASPDFQIRYSETTNWLTQTNNNKNGISRDNDYEKASNAATAGLSKFHQRMLFPLQQRQRFITGRYPLHVSVQNNPTRKWLRQVSSKNMAGTSQVFVNSTIVDQSLASYDRLQWLDNAERKELAGAEGGYSMMTMELIAEINVKKPGYVNLLPSRGAGLSAAMRRSVFDGTGSGIPWGVWKDLEALGVASNEDGDDGKGGVDRLWITGFSLSKPKGELNYLDVDTCIMGTVDDRTSGSVRWPNEVTSVPNQRHSNLPNGLDKTKTTRGKKLDDALLVTDGFLVPGKDKGGLYVVRNPGNTDLEWTVSLTETSTATESNGGGNSREKETGDNWFYHRAVWVDLTGDGRQSILTARAKRPSILKNSGSDASSENDLQSKQTDGQLVWLERPKPHSYDETTGTPLNDDGTVFDPFSTRHTPWKLRVLDVGPDVMFNMADLDPMDNSIEVIASQFFGKKVTLHSILCGPEPKVTFRRILDDQCGSAFSSILADLDVDNLCSSEMNVVIDSGSTIETLKPGSTFSHLLVTSHENAYAENKNGNSQEETTITSAQSASIDASASVNLKDSSSIDWETDYGADTAPFSPTSASAEGSFVDGGSLFAYRVPSQTKDAWKTEPWTRSVIATGFRVKGQIGNMINPGAPGFCYTFYPTKDGPRVNEDGSRSRPLIGISGDCAEAAYVLRPINEERIPGVIYPDESTRYALMCEIDCGATVGSLGISYDDFSVVEQQSGYAKLFIPCFEKDKVLVFAMGSVDNEEEDDDGW